jgi:hypothetical protein
MNRDLQRMNDQVRQQCDQRRRFIRTLQTTNERLFPNLNTFIIQQTVTYD